jgi:CRP-like cAMP-binding protein
MVTRQIISRIDLFKGIPGEGLEAVSAISEEMDYSQGRAVFTEGSKAQHIYILLEGEITIQVSLTSRSGSITVAVINQPYQSFGWSGVVPPHNYTASAICETDCRLITIKSEELIDVLKQEPNSGFIVMQRISELISRRLRNSRIAMLKTL